MKMETVRIGDICEILNGFAFKSENYVDSGIRVIRIANVQKGCIEDSTPVFYPIDSSGLDKYMLERGDLLMSLTGNVGRVAILAEEFLPAALNQRVACLRMKSDKVSKEYLYHILNSDYFEQKCIQSSKGVAQKNMSTEWLKDYEIPLYPEQKQKEIVTVLGEVQTIITNRRIALQRLDELIKARFVEMFGEINEFCDVGHYITALVAGKSLAGEEECENKVLKTGAASFDFFDASQVKNLPLDYVPQHEHLVNVGDIIISRMNTAELTGAAAYVWDVPEKVYLPDRLWKAVLRDGCNPIFVWQMLIQPSTKEQIRRECSGTSGSMKNISKAGMLAIKVKKVPVALQNQFAAFVAQVDKSKVVVQKALDETQLLFDCLMHKYFG